MLSLRCLWNIQMEMWRKWNCSLELGREVRAIDVDLKVVKI